MLLQVVLEVLLLVCYVQGQQTKPIVPGSITVKSWNTQRSITTSAIIEWKVYYGTAQTEFTIQWTRQNSGQAPTVTSQNVNTGITTASGLAQSATITNLVYGATYSVTVKPIGCSEVTAETQNIKVSAHQPRNIQVHYASLNSVTLNWTEPSTVWSHQSVVSDYEVKVLALYKPDPPSNSVGSITSTGCEIVNLVAGNTYAVEVKSRLNGVLSPVAETKLFTARPAIPRNVQVDVLKSSNALYVTWQPGNERWDEFKVSYTKSGVTETLKTVGVTSYVIQGLDAASTYTIKVRAVSGKVNYVDSIYVVVGTYTPPTEMSEFSIPVNGQTESGNFVLSTTNNFNTGDIGVIVPSGTQYTCTSNTGEGPVTQTTLSGKEMCIYAYSFMTHGRPYKFTVTSKTNAAETATILEVARPSQLTTFNGTISDKTTVNIMSNSGPGTSDGYIITYCVVPTAGSGISCQPARTGAVPESGFVLTPSMIGNTVTVKNLVPRTPYRFIANARKAEASGRVPPSTFEINTKDTAPKPVLQLQKSSNSNPGRVALAWTVLDFKERSSISHFVISWNGSKKVKVGDTETTSQDTKQIEIKFTEQTGPLSYEITGLKSGFFYTISVQAKNGLGVSSPETVDFFFVEYDIQKCGANPFTVVSTNGKREIATKPTDKNKSTNNSSAIGRQTPFLSVAALLLCLYAFQR